MEQSQTLGIMVRLCHYSDLDARVLIYDFLIFSVRIWTVHYASFKADGLLMFTLQLMSGSMVAPNISW